MANILHPFSESVGTISRIRGNTIVLTSTIAIAVPSSEIARWRNKLRVGALVGILALDDGTIRVRRIERKIIQRPVAV